MPLTEDDDRSEILNALIRYLKIDEPEDLHDKDALKAMMDLTNVNK